MARSLLTTAVLVVGAFVVYDLWRGPGSHDAARPARDPDVTTGTAPRIDERFAAIARRLDALEARVAELARVEPAPPVASPAPSPAPPPVRDVPSLPGPHDDDVTAEEVARFLALERAAIHHRRAEAVARALARKLDGMPEPPEGDERARVLEESLRIWSEAERVRTHDAVMLDPRARRDAVERLARDLEDTLRSFVGEERRKAIVELVSAHLGLAPGTSLDAGAGAQAAADEPPR